MASLTVLHGEEEGEAFALNAAEVVIGREEGCAIRIEGLGLSRRHCSVSQTGDRFLLRDLHSENGTWVNGERITERELRDGDHVGLGLQASLRFRNEAQSGTAALTPPPPKTAHPPADEEKADGAQDASGNAKATRVLLILILLGLAALIWKLLEFTLER